MTDHYPTKAELAERKRQYPEWEARLAELRTKRETHRGRDTQKYILVNRGIFRFDPDDSEAAACVSEHGIEPRKG